MRSCPKAWKTYGEFFKKSSRRWYHGRCTGSANKHQMRLGQRWSKSVTQADWATENSVSSAGYRKNGTTIGWGNFGIKRQMRHKWFGCHCDAAVRRSIEWRKPFSVLRTPDRPDQGALLVWRWIHLIVQTTIQWAIPMATVWIGASAHRPPEFSSAYERPCWRTP